ncbi:phosphoglycerate kinase [Haemophilus influenzae]|uniref:Uncharacterized protein n=1 Tax=Haemophilus influenzae TaxID=727 RepID=A0AAQ0L1R5_HAEIF|nr:phosphoglycerate kinase [Haemophilus influenzae]RFN96295.1 phosphoglycerate kinase [Haemophilus influenzae]SQG35530.1 Uncharacterised protein [Haemophilus influenzae]VTX59701.1 Uncharacterised protein [Haemophilus influenzae]
MGLDAYAYTLAYEPEQGVDFSVPQGDATLFFQWRKNWDLQEMMAMIYFDKGGQDDIFNCAKVVLDEDDLAYLEECIREADYAYEYPDDRELERERDLNFVKLAKEKIRQGLTVFYDSWW